MNPPPGAAPLRVTHNRTQREDGIATQDEWYPIRITLASAPSHPHPIRVEDVRVRDNNLILDAKAVQRGAEIAPGEQYVLTVRVKPTLIQAFELSAVGVLTSDAPAEPKWLHGGAIDVRPSLDAQVYLEVEPLVAYDDVGTRVQVTLHHDGRTVFDDFELEVLDPEATLAAGKERFFRLHLAPGAEESFELVVRRPILRVAMRARTGGTPVQSQPHTYEIAPAERERRQGYSFLDETRLRVDRVQIVPKGTRMEVPRRGGRPVIRAAEEYTVRIRPRDGDAAQVTLYDVPNVLHVRPGGGRRESGEWEFKIELARSDRLDSYDEDMAYRVELDDGSAHHSDISLMIRPRRGRHARLAFAVGLAFTAQGLWTLGRYVFGQLPPLDEVGAAGWLGNVLDLAGLLSIPTLWVLFRITDELYYWLIHQPWWTRRLVARLPETSDAAES